MSNYEFRVDVESFVARKAVEACIVNGRLELPPAGLVLYMAFVDPSGGSHDAMTLAVAHRVGECVVLDCLRDIAPPFSPDAATAELARTLKTYGIRTVTGDRYGGAWPSERFGAHGVTYRASDRTRSEIYQESLPLLNARRVELLDHARLVAQICALERRTSRAGRDTIDHGPHGADDLANAALGALLLASRRSAIDLSRIVIPDFRRISPWSFAGGGSWIEKGSDRLH